MTEFIEPVIEQMLQDAQHSESEKVKQFSLLTLGEMGRRLPLGPAVIQQQISQFKVCITVGKILFEFIVFIKI